MPWEKEVYVTLLTNHIKEENEKRRRDKKWYKKLKTY